MGFTLNDVQATILQETPDPEFRAAVREVLLSAASLPMVSLEILGTWSDVVLEAHRVAAGGVASEVACTIANISVGHPDCGYEAALHRYWSAQIPVARIADVWSGEDRIGYRGRVWRGNKVVCEAIRVWFDGWIAGEDADFLCAQMRHQG